MITVNNTLIMTITSNIAGRELEKEIKKVFRMLQINRKLELTQLLFLNK